MSDVSRKVDPDKGGLNRERPVMTGNQSPKVSIFARERVFFSPSELERSVPEVVYTERHDDRYREGYHQ